MRTNENFKLKQTVLENKKVKPSNDRSIVDDKSKKRDLKVSVSDSKKKDVVSKHFGIKDAAAVVNSKKQPNKQVVLEQQKEPEDSEHEESYESEASEESSFSDSEVLTGKVVSGSSFVHSEEPTVLKAASVAESESASVDDDQEEKKEMVVAKQPNPLELSDSPGEDSESEGEDDKPVNKQPTSFHSSSNIFDEIEQEDEQERVEFEKLQQEKKKTPSKSPKKRADEVIAVSKSRPKSVESDVTMDRMPKRSAANDPFLLRTPNKSHGVFDKVYDNLLDLKDIEEGWNVLHKKLITLVGSIKKWTVPVAFDDSLTPSRLNYEALRQLVPKESDFNKMENFDSFLHLVWCRIHCFLNSYPQFRDFRFVPAIVKHLFAGENNKIIWYGASIRFLVIMAMTRYTDTFVVDEDRALDLDETWGEHYNILEFFLNSFAISRCSKQEKWSSADDALEMHNRDSARVLVRAWNHLKLCKVDGKKNKKLNDSKNKMVVESDVLKHIIFAHRLTVYFFHGIFFRIGGWSPRGPYDMNKWAHTILQMTLVLQPLPVIRVHSYFDMVVDYVKFAWSQMFAWLPVNLHKSFPAKHELMVQIKQVANFKVSVEEEDAIGTQSEDEEDEEERKIDADDDEDAASEVHTNLEGPVVEQSDRHHDSDMEVEEEPEEEEKEEEEEEHSHGVGHSSASHAVSSLKGVPVQLSKRKRAVVSSSSSFEIDVSKSSKRSRVSHSDRSDPLKFPKSSYSACRNDICNVMCCRQELFCLNIQFLTKQFEEKKINVEEFHELSAEVFNSFH